MQHVCIRTLGECATASYTIATYEHHFRCDDDWAARQQVFHVTYKWCHPFVVISGSYLRNPCLTSLTTTWSQFNVKPMLGLCIQYCDAWHRILSGYRIHATVPAAGMLQQVEYTASIQATSAFPLRMWLGHFIFGTSAQCQPWTSATTVT